MNKNSYRQNVMIFVRKQGISSISDYVRIIPAVDCHSFYNISLAAFPYRFRWRSFALLSSTLSRTCTLKENKAPREIFLTQSSILWTVRLSEEISFGYSSGSFYAVSSAAATPERASSYCSDTILMFFLNSIKLV